MTRAIVQVQTAATREKSVVAFHATALCHGIESAIRRLMSCHQTSTTTQHGVSLPKWESRVAQIEYNIAHESITPL
jgi:hypothetical protein